MRAEDLINIKLMKTGGIRNALAVCAMARACGVECMIGAMMETKISVTAVCHLASAMPVITRADLDPPILCASDPVEGGAVYTGSTVVPSDGPGLGITNIHGLVLEQAEIEMEEGPGNSSQVFFYYYFNCWPNRGRLSAQNES